MTGACVATIGLGVKVGVTVEVGDRGTSVLVGSEVPVAVGGGIKKGKDKLPQDAISIRMKISIKKRRMNIL